MNARSTTLPLAIVPVGLVFALLLALNLYLLATIAGGAQIVAQVEAAAGHALSCHDAYENRAINAYYMQGGWGGDAVYLFSIFSVLWLSASLVAAYIFSGVLQLPQRLRWWPLGVMSVVVIALVAYLPTVWKLGCALE